MTPNTGTPCKPMTKPGSSELENVENTPSPKKRSPQPDHSLDMVTPETSMDEKKLVEIIVGKLSPILMPATTIAVAPLLKLYENLNESLRDQTTLVALLNSEIVKLELDLIDMTAQVVTTRRGNDISLTALRESLKTTMEDKRLLAEVTKHALMLLQKDREHRMDEVGTCVPQKTQPSLESGRTLNLIDNKNDPVPEDRTSKLNPRLTKPKTIQNCRAEIDSEITIVLSDSPKDSNKKKVLVVDDKVRSSEGKRNSNKVTMIESNESNRDVMTVPHDSSPKEGRSEEMDHKETRHNEKEDKGSENQDLEEPMACGNGKEVRTPVNSKADDLIEKKNETEWFYIFDPKKTKESTGQNMQSRAVALKQSKCKKKSKNQQIQKNKNPRSAANFFRNIKALTITVNNTEPTGTNSKKCNRECSKADGTTAPKLPSSRKIQPTEITEKEDKQKSRVENENYDEEDEELLNMSTYSSAVDDDVVTEGVSEFDEKSKAKNHQEKKKGESSVTDKTLLEPEQEKDMGQSGKSLFMASNSKRR
ncbi:DNA ligase 1-like [Ambystoma mexicanum]|uniref:DNA ligase 1-like n=1 Tax=Ambystoma mexicanum TaxID=8296 RepID=UPI0037E8C8FF